MTVEKVQGFWFSKANRLPHGDGRPVEVDATHDIQGEIELCEWGLHFSESILDALKYAPGVILWRIEAWGDLILEKDKGVARYRKYLWRLDVSEILGRFARACALDVVHLWNAPDIVLEFLKTGDESLRQAAHYAALSAYYAAHTARYAALSTALSAYYAALSARDAARSVHCAARDAARSVHCAAPDAVREKQNLRLLAMIEEARASASPAIA